MRASSLPVLARGPSIILVVATENGRWKQLERTILFAGLILAKMKML
jgi:hypothetical protein